MYSTILALILFFYAYFKRNTCLYLLPLWSSLASTQDLVPRVRYRSFQISCWRIQAFDYNGSRSRVAREGQLRG